MGLSKEILMPETRMILHPVNPSSSEIKVNMPSIKEGGVGARIREISQMLSAESKKEKEKEGQPQKETRTDGFEPFVNPKPTNNPLFINNYTGSFAQRMELNRKGIERVLKIAHLDGKVVLLSMPFSRTRSVDVGLDDNARVGEDNDDEENPFRRVAPTPEGWRIEINDTRIMEDLQKKNLTAQKLQTEFIQRFNAILRNALFESVLREKLTIVKDKAFLPRYALSLLQLNTLSRLLVIYTNNFSEIILKDTATGIGLYFAVAGLINKFSRLRKNIDSPLEYFAPPVEIDKVVRSAAFLAVKGRTLVREAKPETK